MGRHKGSNKNNDYKDWIVEVFSNEDKDNRINYSFFSSAKKISDELCIPIHKVYNHSYERIKPIDELKFITIRKTN